jgi:hypothetical protein
MMASTVDSTRRFIESSISSVVIRGLDPRIHPEIVIPGRELSAKLTKSILRWASEPGIQNSARCWIPGMRPRGRIPE